MAKEVEYFEDFDTDTPERRNEAFSEGPFVLVYANGWRIECERIGYHCPTLPDVNIYRWLAKMGYRAYKSDDKAEMVKSCDFLNRAVGLKLIRLHGKTWLLDAKAAGFGQC